MEALWFWECLDLSGGFRWIEPKVEEGIQVVFESQYYWDLQCPRDDWAWGQSDRHLSGHLDAGMHCLHPGIRVPALFEQGGDPHCWGEVPLWVFYDWDDSINVVAGSQEKAQCQLSKWKNNIKDHELVDGGNKGRGFHSVAGFSLTWNNSDCLIFCFLIIGPAIL